MSWRRSLAALALALWPALASAQFTLVGQDYELCGGSAATCVFGTGVTAQAGDLVVVLINNRDGIDISTVTDAVNSGYTCPDSQDLFDGGGGQREHACYFINSGAGTIAPTVTWASNSRGEGNFQVWRPTGTVTFDAATELIESSTLSHVTTSLSTSASAALVLCHYGFGGVAGTITVGSGYTLLTDGATRWGGQYDITSVGSGSFTCPMTTANSVGSSALALSFNDSGGGGGGGGTGGRLLRLGVGAPQ